MPNDPALWTTYYCLSFRGKTWTAINGGCEGALMISLQKWMVQRFQTTSVVTAKKILIFDVTGDGCSNEMWMSEDAEGHWMFREGQQTGSFGCQFSSMIVDIVGALYTFMMWNINFIEVASHALPKVF